MDIVTNELRLNPVQQEVATKIKIKYKDLFILAFGDDYPNKELTIPIYSSGQVNKDGRPDIDEGRCIEISTDGKEIALVSYQRYEENDRQTANDIDDFLYMLFLSRSFGLGYWVYAAKYITKEDSVNEAWRVGLSYHMEQGEIRWRIAVSYAITMMSKISEAWGIKARTKYERIAAE